MNAPAKLAAFTALLAACGGGAAVAGSALDPDAPGGGEPRAATHGPDAPGYQQRQPVIAVGSGGRSEHGDDHAHDRTFPVEEHTDTIVSVDEKLELDVLETTFAAGERAPLRFRILGEDGAPRTDFEVEHEKRMHVIVVRKDLTGFQHLHPEMSEDGMWSVPLTLEEAGAYRVYADFADGTLSADLTVPGDAHAHELPGPASTADAGNGYTVELTGGQNAKPGKELTLPFTVRKDGKPVTVEPYLGADGHLVAISAKDLEFLHVHPMDGAFMATFPRAGEYRLFLQFQHAGEIRTAEFTQEVT